MKTNILNVNTGYMKPLGVCIHNDAGTLTGIEYDKFLKNHRLENGFAHYYVSKGSILQSMYTDRVAWHTGNAWGNGSLIGFEVCQSMSATDDEFLANEEETFKLAAEVMKSYKLPVNENTVFLHRELSATACPHRSWELHGKSVSSVKKYFIERILHYYNGGTLSAKTTKKPTQAQKDFNKTDEQLADDVINGKLGHGVERQKRLGKRYQNVQHIVNQKLTGTYRKKIPKKSNTDVAKEVIQGKWSNGATRDKLLRQAGYNPYEIQSIVNKMLR